MKLGLILIVLLIPALSAGQPSNVQIHLKEDLAQKVWDAVAAKKLNENENGDLRRQLLRAMNNPKAAGLDAKKKPFKTLSIPKTSYDDLAKALKATTNQDKKIGDPVLWDLCREFNLAFGNHDDCDALYDVHRMKTPNRADQSLSQEDKIAKSEQ